MKQAKQFGTILLLWVIISCQTGFAQTGSQNTNEKLIRAYYTAFEKKDWNSMEQILADGFTFSSPLDDHIKLNAFKERCWPNAYKIKKFDIDKVLINGDVAFVITNGWTTEGKLFRNSDYFKLKDGKISEYECFFGPGVNYPNSGK
jgi:SnoaL-like domain